MTLYATCERCEAIKEVLTPADQKAWKCPRCSAPKPVVMGRPRRRPTARLCAGCDRTFAPRRAEQRFCSRPCATKDSVRRYFTAEARRRGALNSAAKKRAMLPTNLSDAELDAYRRGYKRGYVLGYNAQRRERKPQAA